MVSRNSSRSVPAQTRFTTRGTSVAHLWEGTPTPPSRLPAPLGEGAPTGPPPHVSVCAGEDPRSRHDDRVERLVNKVRTTLAETGRQPVMPDLAANAGF